MKAEQRDALVARMLGESEGSLAMRQRRLDLEREYAEGEARRKEHDRLAGGGKTSRQRAAQDLLAYLDVVSRGRWLPHDELRASRDSLIDGGRALRVVEEAAKAAVAEALAPLLEAAQAEYQAATAERDALVRGTAKL